MSKTITRKYIQRITRNENSTSIRRNSGGGGGGGGVSQYWVDDNYVSKEFFNRLFEIHDENGDPILPNDVETEIDNIQAMFGFWTNAYLSALGQNEGGGGAELTLASLADVAVQGVTDGQALVWSASRGKWVPGEGGGGLDPTAMWAELATTGTQQINKTHLTTALSDFVTIDTAQTISGTKTFSNTVFLSSISEPSAGNGLLVYKPASGWSGISSTQWGVGAADLQGVIRSSNTNLIHYKGGTSYTIWDASNDGSGSGLDADLLDGHHAADFALASAITDMATQTWVSTNYLTKTDANNTYLSIAFFRALFRAYTSGGSEVVPNGGSTSTIDNIKAMFGFWTNSYLSALGNNPGGASLTLSSLSDVSISGATAGQVLTYRNGTWRNETPQGGGGSVTSIVTGGTTYSPTNGVVTLPDYIVYTNENQLYLNASFLKAEYSQKAAQEYIEFWDSTGGWFNFKLGTLYAVSDVKVGNNSVIHAGNIGSQSVSYATTAGSTKILSNYYTSRPSSPDLTLGDGSLVYFLSSDSMVTHKPAADGGIIHMSWDNMGMYETQLFVSNNSSSNINVVQYRTQSGGNWSRWYNVITEQNLSNYSVGSAEKLGTARSLWGQSFDGTANVKGSLQYVTSIEMNSDGALSGYGGFIDFHYNGSSADYTSRIIESASGRLVLNNVLNIINDGNVGIGTTSPAYKLDVNGDVQATNFRGNFVGNADSATKLQTARTIWGQSFDGTANVSGAITGATTISASSNVSVGGTLSVSGTSTLTGHVGIGTSPHSTYVLRANGEVYVSTGLYSHGYVTALSDIRHKDVMGDVKLTVSEVANAPAVKFLWKDRRQEGLQVGSIAQYWQKVLPEAIVEAADGELTMSYGVIALLASIANAREIVNLKREIAELKRTLSNHGILE